MEKPRYIWGYQQGDGKHIYFEDLNSFEVGEPDPRYADYLEFSDEAIAIRAQVTKPIAERPRVGYNAEWLWSYRPNIDYYLTAEERARLHLIGTTEENDQPAGSFAKNMLERLLIDLSWNSSRLEDNSYSLLDTDRLIRNQLPNDRRTGTETQMIINHKEAIQFIVDQADQMRFNPMIIRNLQSILAFRLMENDQAEGNLREIPVGIGRCTYTPLIIPAQIEELFILMLNKADQIEDPFEQSFFIMVHLPYLQPFEDVNKRTSRLAANIPLNRYNLVPLSFIGMEKDDYVYGLLGVYELNKIALYKETYIRAYQRSVRNYAKMRQILRKPDPLIERYDLVLKDMVKQVITQRMDKAAASAYIDKCVQSIPFEHRIKVTENASRSLLALHEYNFAVYSVSLETFKAWKEQW